VDEFLTEKEQIEQIRRWWQENGWYLLGGIAIAVLGYVGYYQYQAYRDARAEQAAALYAQLQETLEDDRGRGEELLGQLRADYPDSPYTHQASLLLASELLISDPARATQELRYVMENSSDPGLAFIARLRLARVLTYRESYQEALEVLDVPDPGEFAARLNEIKGDVHAALGEIDAARSAYTQALTAPGSESVDRNFVQMKLNGLGASPSAPAQPEGEA
jgi:predicted negative regulator of RcsB-dependent stress response